MLAVIQEVELVNGGAWWHGPVVAACAAIAVAAIAAYTANRRQAAQLRHDRDLHFREGTRDVVDKAATTAIATLRAVTELEVEIRDGEDPRKAAEMLGSSPKGKTAAEAEEILAKLEKSGEEVIRALTSAGERIEDLQTEGVRLSLRMGFKDSAVDAYNAFEKASRARKNYLYESIESGLKRADKLKELEKAQTDEHARFLSECDVWYEEGRISGTRSIPWPKFWRRREEPTTRAPDPDASSTMG